MRVLLRIALCACLAAAVVTAQRGGGGGARGGGGGGFHGGGGNFHGGGVVGGLHGGGGNFHGGGVVGGLHGGGGFGHGGGSGFSGFRGRFGFRSYGYGGYYGGWPLWDFGYSYWPGYYDYPYSSNAYDPYGYGYNPSPNVTVVYPSQAQTAPSTVYVERANPVVREYDQYGQEVKPSSSSGEPIYLLAFADHVIRAAAAYWVDGKTLHYVTLEREHKQAPLDTVDRNFSLQLNRERHVAFSLPTP